MVRAFLHITRASRPPELLHPAVKTAKTIKSIHRTYRFLPERNTQTVPFITLSIPLNYTDPL
jgi:hypothetical protein